MSITAVEGAIWTAPNNAKLQDKPHLSPDSGGGIINRHSRPKAKKQKQEPLVRLNIHERYRLPVRYGSLSNPSISIQK